MINSTKILIIILASFSFIISINSASAILLTDLGVDAQNVSSGALLTTGDLNIQIYDNATDGTLIYNYTFVSAITNGSWNVVIDPTIEYGKFYWKDYAINGEDLDYNGEERIEFQSYAGIINNASFFNFTLISPCAAGEAIQQVYENGSVLCATITSSGSGGWTNDSITTSTDLNVNVTGNITTSNYGFFGSLGSLISRITNLFVQDVDVSNNVVAAGNVSATYFIGNGSLLTGIISSEGTTYSHLSNFTDDLGNRGYTHLSNFTNNLDLSAYNDTDWVIGQGYLTSVTDNSIKIRYENITNMPVCSGTDKLSFNGTLFCSSDLNTNTVYTHLSNFTDDLGDRGYTHLSNFTNNLDLSAYNDTVLANQKALPGTCAAGKVVQNTTTLGVKCVDLSVTESDPVWLADKGSYSTTANILAFGYYNSSDFIITDYFTKAEISNFNYYNSSNFDINNYLTSSEILAFNYYNASDFDISNYFTSAQVLGFDYYNSTDFVITDYYTKLEVYNKTEIDNLIPDLTNYYTKSDVYNKTEIDAFNYLATESDPMWTGNQSSYSTTAQILAFSYYNATDFDISDYFTSAQVLGFNYYNSTTLSESDPVFTAENASIYSSINAKLDSSDQRYNDTTLANAKALPGTCSGNQVVQNTTTSGVQCVTPSITETDPNAYNGTLAYNSSLANYYLLSNPFGFYNSTNPQTEADPMWTSNYTAFNASWSSTYNSTYNTWAYNQTTPAIAAAYNGTLASAASLSSYYLASNPFGFYNSTNPQTESDPKYVADNGTIARTGICGAGTYASATTITGVTCSTPPGANNAHTHDALNITTPTGLNNKITLAYQNITGTQQAGCTGGQVLTNVTQTNGVLSSTCVASSGGGGRTLLGSYTAPDAAQTSISVSYDPTGYNKIEYDVYIPTIGTGTSTIWVRFNDISTTTYAWQKIVTVTSTTAVSQTSCLLETTASQLKRTFRFQVMDTPSSVAQGVRWEGILFAANAGTAPVPIIGTCHWDNAATITKVTLGLTTASRQFGTGSYINVYGYS